MPLELWDETQEQAHQGNRTQPESIVEPATVPSEVQRYIHQEIVERIADHQKGIGNSTGGQKIFEILIKPQFSPWREVQLPQRKKRINDLGNPKVHSNRR